MRYDLNLLRVFLALMEERNVTRAAEKLGITQPALSNALTRLRATLLDPLFIRERYGMRPTQKAEELAPVIAGALVSLDDVILGQQDFEWIGETKGILAPPPRKRNPRKPPQTPLGIPTSPASDVGSPGMQQQPATAARSKAGRGFARSGHADQEG